MPIPFFNLSTFIQSNNHSNVNALISMVKLRVTMLLLMLVILFFWHFIVSPFTQWHIAAITTVITFAWSFAFLNIQKLQVTPFADIREVLVDICWVLASVMVAGSTTNPFIYYYLVITAFAATLLSNKKAWLVWALCVLIYSVLLMSDVKNHFEHFSNDYKIHLIGMWVNYVGSAAVICFFVSKLMSHLRKQQENITVIRENNLKNEQLIGLATVAASTMHNLNTPLSTLTVLIDDVASNHQLDQDLNNDLALMRQQISRCNSTIHELSEIAQNSHRQTRVSIGQLASDIKNHYALHHPEKKPNIATLCDNQLQIQCNALFKYAVINLMNNALDASSLAEMIISSAQNNIYFAIKNSHDQSIEKLTQHWGKPTTSSKETGLGIGAFLANSTIEKQGGSVALEVTPKKSGEHRNHVLVTITFPIAKM